jgi:hypothetical protein
MTQIWVSIKIGQKLFYISSEACKELQTFQEYSGLRSLGLLKSFTFNFSIILRTYLEDGYKNSSKMEPVVNAIQTFHTNTMMNY